MTSTAADPTSSITTSREFVQDALDANKRLQQFLTQRAVQLEADLKEADNLLVSVPSFFGIPFSPTSTHKTGGCQCR
jgi:hypothetical protein